MPPTLMMTRLSASAKLRFMMAVINSAAATVVVVGAAEVDALVSATQQSTLQLVSEDQLLKLQLMPKVCFCVVIHRCGLHNHNLVKSIMLEG